VTIPIRNIYYLLLYAWDHLEEREDVLLQGLESTQVADLFGRLLHGSITRLVRRGIDRSYVGCIDDLAGVRGRIELTPTLRRKLLGRGHTICSFDELTVDCLPNRILKAAAERILNTRPLERRVELMMRECVALLRGVRSVPLTRHLCKQAQIHQNNRAYRLPLAIAELLVDNLLVEDRTGSFVFRDFDRSEGPLAILFQSFVQNFMRREQSIFRVANPALKWRELEGSPEAQALIPMMFTDLTLERYGYTAIIETKYYREVFVERHQTRRIRSAHLYQIYAYMQNLSRLGSSVDGVLLYAQGDQPVDIEVRLGVHRVRVVTLDLSSSWENIHAALINVASWASEGAQASADA
jgi:5-methylcytosine-specific restriction enzyme subunit McrC